MHANAFGGSELLDTGMLKSSNFEDLAAWIEHIAAFHYRLGTDRIRTIR